MNSYVLAAGALGGGKWSLPTCARSNCGLDIRSHHPSLAEQVLPWLVCLLVLALAYLVFCAARRIKAGAQ